MGTLSSIIFLFWELFYFGLLMGFIMQLCELSKADKLSIIIFMEDIDVIIGKNLRRLREKNKLSQDDLAAMIDTPKSRISGIENGRVGMGKDVMMRVCRALTVNSWEFHLTDKTPIIKDRQELEDIQQRREADLVGIADMVREAEASWIVAAKKKEGFVGEGKKGGIQRRIRKRAG